MSCQCRLGSRSKTPGRQCSYPAKNGTPFCLVHKNCTDVVTSQPALPVPLRPVPLQPVPVPIRPIQPLPVPLRPIPAIKPIPVAAPSAGSKPQTSAVSAASKSPAGSSSASTSSAASASLTVSKSPAALSKSPAALSMPKEEPIVLANVKSEATSEYVNYYKKYRPFIEHDKSVTAFLKWSYEVIQYGHRYVHNPVEDREIKSVPVALKDLPDDSIDIITQEPYKDDPDWRKRQYVRLLNCDVSCINHGVFAKDEVDINIESGNSSCPYCGSSYYASNQVGGPPYGKAYVNIFHGSSTSTDIEITFDLNAGVGADGAFYQGRQITTFIPYHPAFHIDCMLGVWILLNAFSKGKLFSIGTSLTNGTYGITFGTIHMKTNRGVGKAHGYHRMPLIAYLEPDGVLEHLISESSALGLLHPYSRYTGYSDDDKLRYILKSTNPDILSRYLKYKASAYTDTEALVKGLYNNALGTVRTQDIYLPSGVMIDPEEIIAVINTYSLKKPLSQPSMPWPIVIHDKGSPLAHYITPEMWNQMGYTQIVHKSGSPEQWFTSRTTYIPYQCANYYVNGKKNTLLVFHGTHYDSLPSFERGIDWTKGGGKLGRGFYITLSPNEAKGYGCRALASKDAAGYLVVLEMHLHNATSDFLVLDQHDKISSQFVGREALVSNLVIVRAHVFHYCEISHPFRLGMPMDIENASSNRGIVTLQTLQDTRG